MYEQLCRSGCRTILYEQLCRSGCRIIYIRRYVQSCSNEAYMILLFSLSLSLSHILPPPLSLSHTYSPPLSLSHILPPLSLTHILPPSLSLSHILPLSHSLLHSRIHYPLALPYAGQADSTQLRDTIRRLATELETHKRLVSPVLCSLLGSWGQTLSVTD